MLWFSGPLPTYQALPGGPSSPYIGTGIPVTAGWWIGGSSENVDGGGAFEGTVSPTLFSTAFWCVDDQTYFSPVASAPANITLLSNLGSSKPPGLLGQTEYVDAAGKFTLTSDPIGGAILNDPQTRLLMAAYLITQYGGYTASPFSQLPVDNSIAPGGGGHGTNAAVQDAIWAITNNTAFTGANGHTGPGTHGTSDTNVQYWIDQAALNYGGVSGNSWALVTWAVNSSGIVTDAQQNFLVRVTPEPGFYGVLALWLSA